MDRVPPCGAVQIYLCYMKLEVLYENRADDLIAQGHGEEAPRRMGVRVPPPAFVFKYLVWA